MIRHYHAASALLPTGWARNVAIAVGDDGVIKTVAADAPAQGEMLAGPVVPGMPNLHSHAFQRAMTGLTEKAGPRGDNFWSWRELMYRFLTQLTPDDIEIIAAQLYGEMLEVGYTSVAEFHYLHHDADGQPYANPAETAERIAAAAHHSGIGLTLLPVLYTHGNFGGQAPNPGQRRFLNDIDAWSDLVARSATALRGPLQRIGVAPHSLRAVTPAQLIRVQELARSLGSNTPIHIHAAEQRKEVDDCLAWSGQRPVQWLAEHTGLDARWCVVHATHLLDDEVAALARSGAVAGLCPSTEGDLGDGFFPATRYFEHAGRFGIGGDSHAGVDPFFELRLFEYGQRLLHERRNLLSATLGESLGGRLYRGACAGGAQALAQAVGAIAEGMRADLVVLDGDDPALLEQHEDGVLDAAIFGPARKPVRDVMVGGVWQVREGVHRARSTQRERYRGVMKRLLGVL